MSNEALFTPGPWLIGGRAYDLYVVSSTAGRIQVASLVAKELDHSEREANAYLIVTAPEMYRVLSAMVNDDAFEELCHVMGDKPQWLKDAKKVLAEARGEVTA